MKKTIKVRKWEYINRLKEYAIMDSKKTCNPWGIMSPGKRSKLAKEQILRNKIKEKTISFAKKAWIVCFVSWLILIWWAKLYAYADNSIRDNRLKICEEEYEKQKEWVDSRYIHKSQDIIKRCATYSTLIKAFESNYWKSRKCIKTKNCHWLKWNWIDTPAWFLKFKTYEEWERYFAKKYFRWHFNKTINVFVRNWSMTDQNVYISFVKNKYWDIYNSF